MPTFKANPFDLEDFYHDDSEDHFHEQQERRGMYRSKTSRAGGIVGKFGLKKFNHNLNDT